MYGETIKERADKIAQTSPAALVLRVARLERALTALLDDIASNPFLAVEAARSELGD